MDLTLKMHEGIPEFYEGKSVFVTGGAGYVGSVVIETLLHCCPKIGNVYILLREKKGVCPGDRLKQILQKKIFTKLRNSDPEVIGKMKIVEGDVTREDLGISPEMLTEIRQNVAVVLHCAAIISFIRGLKEMIVSNVIGTKNVIEFSKSLPELVAFIHCSTAFSNCNIRHIEEKIYNLAVAPEEFIDAAREGNDAKLQELSEMCSPPWPNTYTFTKAIAEELVAKEAKGLRVAIVRPSMVVCSWKGSLPGYVETGTGLIDLSVAVGKGFINVLYTRDDKLADFIPVDVVANTMITAAWYIGTRKVEDPLIVNCTTSQDLKITWGSLAKTLYQFTLDNPLPKMYQRPSLIIRCNALTYWPSICVNHYVPALCIDAVLMASGKKPILTKLYRFYDKVFGVLRFFVDHDFDFECRNFKMLASEQNAEDSLRFPMNIKDIKVEEMAQSLLTGSPFYDWKNDKRSFDARMSVSEKRYLLTTFIKWTAIFWFFSLLGLLLWASMSSPKTI